MQVTAGSWQPSDAAYRSSQISQNRKTETDTTYDPQEAMDTDILKISSSALTKAGTDSKTESSSASAEEAKSGSGFKMKSSGPQNTVGELASMLARAESLMDVQQVYSKAMRALTDLRMGAMASEGKDAKKYAQQIKRMEKLIKRINKKLKHLAKEQGMEQQAEKAAKRAELEKEKQIRQELEARRRKRHREEKEYALKQQAEDGKTSVNETVSSMLDAASPSADISSLSEFSGDVMSDMMSADFSGMDMGGLDIMV